MKKITVLAICLIFAFSAAHAQGKKERRVWVNKSSSERKTASFATSDRKVRAGFNAASEDKPGKKRPDAIIAKPVLRENAARGASNKNTGSIYRTFKGGKKTDNNGRFKTGAGISAGNKRSTVSSGETAANAKYFAGTKNGAEAASRQTVKKAGDSRGSWVWHHPGKKKPSVRHYRPRTYYPYSYYYRPLGFGGHLKLLFFPFDRLSVSYGCGYEYPYGYYPYYTGFAVYNAYNGYSYFRNERLSADYTMLAASDDAGDDEDKEEFLGISEIRLRGTRLITDNGIFIGFEIDNGSNYHISAISFALTLRGMRSSEKRSGIFFKLDKILPPGEKKFYKIPLDDLKLVIPETYTLFAEIESITTPSGEIAVNE